MLLYEQVYHKWTVLAEKADFLIDHVGLLLKHKFEVANCTKKVDVIDLALYPSTKNNRKA